MWPYLIGISDCLFKFFAGSWITRDYILNYPNILPKELMTVETSLLNKEGKKVWLSWVNSILPNDNYVDIGLDITKYKHENNLITMVPK